VSSIFDQLFLDEWGSVPAPPPRPPLTMAAPPSSPVGTISKIRGPTWAQAAAAPPPPLRPRTGPLAALTAPGRGLAPSRPTPGARLRGNPRRRGHASRSPPRKWAKTPSCDACSRPQVCVSCGPDETRVLAGVCEQPSCRRKTANYLRDVALAIDVVPIPSDGEVGGRVDVTFKDGQLVCPNGR
jgi:hypothetical protein